MSDLPTSMLDPAGNRFRPRASRDVAPSAVGALLLLMIPGAWAIPVPHAAPPAVSIASAQGPTSFGAPAVDARMTEGPARSSDLPQVRGFPTPDLSRGLGTVLLPRLASGSPSRGSNTTLSSVLARVPGVPSGLATIRLSVGPSDLDLTGSMGLQISQNTTVRNISLSGNSTLYVHNDSGAVTLTVLGNIAITQNALLFLNASTLHINESYDVEWDLQMTGHTRFVAEGSNVTTNGYQWGAAYEGNANVTILSSLFCYPVGWIDTDLVEGATLDLAFSGYSSDVILFDAPTAPSTANFSAAYSAGFNIWLNFRAGAVANITLPGLEGWRNWSFPGTSAVTGVNYTVNVFDSFVLVFAVMLGQGSNLTLRDSPDVALSFNIFSGNLTLLGLQERRYATFSVRSDGFDLSLLNTTIFTWNVYPFAGSALIFDSQVGEIQVFGSANASVLSSNLTGHGGYYGEQGTGTLSIEGSTLAGQVVGYSGLTTLEDCTVNTSYASRVLATGTGTINALEVRLGTLDAYQAQAAGTVNEYWSTQLNLTEPGGPAAGASVSVRYLQNQSVAVEGTANSTGAWIGYLLGTVVTSAGTTTNNFTALASDGFDGGQLLIPAPTDPTWDSLALIPLVSGSVPGNGSAGVATDLTTLGIEFTMPMDPSATSASFGLVPSVPFTTSWDLVDRNLTVQLGAALSPNTTYTWSLGPSAATRSGIVPTGTFRATFVTAGIPPPPPKVSGTSPSNGSQGVYVWANVTVTFDAPMNVSSLLGALSVSPSVPSGTTAANRTAILWSHTSPFANNTTYTVTVARTASSANGTGLTTPLTFSFRTVAPTHRNNTSKVPPSTPGTTVPSSGASWALYLGLAGLVALVALLLGWQFLIRRRPATPPPENPASSVAPAPSGSGTPPSAPTPDWSEETGAPPPRP